MFANGRTAIVAAGATAGGVTTRGIGAPSGASSAATTSDALAGRSSGSLPRHCITMLSIEGVTSEVSVASGVGCSVMCATMSACAVRRSENGCRPASSSYAITPNA